LSKDALSKDGDGDYYNEHPLFKEDPTALQVYLYYDELESCNALESKTKKHKLGKCMYEHYGWYGDTIVIQVSFTTCLETLIPNNPAACSLGGYKQLHSAFRKCRKCMAVDADMQTKVGIISSFLKAVLKLSFSV
jgi:hypothetical protein